jgi:RNA ligase (TIGR02306 family)
MSDEIRKLASIRKIDNIQPIVGADAIEVATLGGWKVVVKVGEFKIGDLAIYIEIDSWVPESLAPFLTKGQNAKEYEGIVGNRLRTVTLRGQISQGLLLKLDMKDGRYFMTDKNNAAVEVHEGDNVSEHLGIVKWEPAIPAELAGEMVGYFPSFGKKTDAERIQNIDAETLNSYMDLEFEITVKRDGSSCSIYHYDAIPENQVGVCSRNINLKITPDASNTFVKMFNELDCENVLRSLGMNVMIQAELFGPGIQDNFEKVSKHTLEVFNVYDIDKQRDLVRDERLQVISAFNAVAGYDALKSVPVVAITQLKNIGTTHDELLEAADGPSAGAGRFREGLVYKSTSLVDGKVVVFKTVSNLYLNKTGK